LGQLDVNGWTIVWSAAVVVITCLLARDAGRAILRLCERVTGLPVMSHRARRVQ
jgi:hypothetical protein